VGEEAVEVVEAVVVRCKLPSGSIKPFLFKSIEPIYRQQKKSNWLRSLYCC
jgi:hypothetical protein